MVCFHTRKVTFEISRFPRHLIKSVEGATMARRIFYREMLSWLLSTQILFIHHSNHKVVVLNFLTCHPRHEQEVFLAAECHLNLLLHSLWYQCPPVSQYVFEHPGDGCVTFYKTWPRFRRTMALRLLSCRAPGTQLIIYLACVYLCWTRLSGGGSRERKADTILPASVRGAQNPEGPPALLGRAFLFTDAHVRETEVAAMQQCQQGLWSDLHTNTRFNWH